MQGLILAAGMGKRLGHYTQNNTKCMIKVNGKTLIEHLLEGLSDLNLNRIIIVIGYEGEKLQEFIRDSYKGIPIVYINNEIYNKTNNIYSLWLASKEFEEDDTILLESDIIFEKKVLKDIVENPDSNIAVVAKFESWMDGTVICTDEENNIVDFISKKNFKWSNVENYYKTVNIYKFSKQFIKNYYLPFLNSYINAIGKNEYYEQVLSVLTHINSVDFKAHKLKNEKWYEIDDKQDLDIAENLFAESRNKLSLYQKRFGGYWRFPKLKDFCYLVNPYFPNKLMNAELKANFDVLISEYPSGQNVQNLLASKMFNCNEEEILVGNGAAELIKALLTTIEGKVGVLYPTFNEYPERVGKERVEAFVLDNEDFKYTVEDLKKFSDTVSSLILINPDNPSGHFLKKDEVIELLEHLNKKNIKLILDESFIDFTCRDEVYTLLDSEYLQKYKNLIVIKSVSKSYGVPGIRLGVIACGDKKLINNVRKELSIWNINSFGEYFLQIIDKYKKDYIKACDKINYERDRFFKELSKIRFLRVIPSRANYFLCEVKGSFSATELTNLLLNQYNLFIKDCTGKTGFNNKEYVRIAVRDENDNNLIISILQNIDDEIEKEYDSKQEQIAICIFNE